MREVRLPLQFGLAVVLAFAGTHMMVRYPGLINGLAILSICAAIAIAFNKGALARIRAFLSILAGVIVTMVITIMAFEYAD